MALGCLVLAVPGLAWGAVVDDVSSTATGPLDETLKTGKDTVTKTVDAVLEPVRETAKPVTDTVDEATKPVRDAVEEAVKPVTDTVDEVTEPVTDPVTDVTDPITDVGDPVTKDPDPQRPTPTTVAPPIRQRTPDRQPAAQSPQRKRRASDAGPARGRPAGAPTVVPVRPRQFTAAAAIASRPGRDVVVRADAPPTPAGVGDAVAEASRAFRFPLLLAAAVLLFLGIQGRLDSKDPKLAAPVVDEELTFA